MTKRLFATGLLALVLVLGAASASHAFVRRPPRTVVLLLAPYLRWEDVVSGHMPETTRLAAVSAVGDMNVRSLLPDAGQPAADAGALMISAGTWAGYDASATPPAEASGTPAVTYPGLGKQREANARQDADIRLGTLGQAIRDAGGVTAAIGNADAPGRPSRPAALVAMDAKGRVELGDVSPATLDRGADPDAPFGVVSDAARLDLVLRDVLADRQGRQGPMLVVVDPGDLSRAHEAAAGTPEGLDRLDRLAALRAFDGVLASVRSRVPPGGLLVVAAPVAAQVAGQPSGFGPLIVSGDGWSGYLASESTHREGIVTSADLNAGILTYLGVTPPVQVAGSPFTARGSRDSGEIRLLRLQRVDAFMRSVDSMRERIVDDFILAVTVVIAAGVVLALRPALPLALARGGQFALLAVASAPAASILMYLVLGLPQTPLLVTGSFLGTAAVLTTVGIATHHTETRPRALSFLALLTAAVIVVDQWAGAPLSLDGLFGYSPLVGARFYGIGNEPAALLVGATLTGFALLFDTHAEHRQWVTGVRTWGFPAAALVCVVTAAAPFLGANVGVAVWGTFAFALGWWGMIGRRITWRAVAFTLAAIVVLVAAFAAADLLLGGGRTHVARAILDTLRDGPGQLTAILARKAALNVRLLTSTNWSLLFAALLAVLAYTRLRPRGTLRDILIERPNFASALSAALIAGVIAYFTEDSGIVVPALLLLFPTIAVVYLMLWRRVSGGGGE